MSQTVGNTAEHSQSARISQVGITADREMGARLRAWRTEKRLNQTQCAEIGGVTINTQGRYEQGYLPPTEYLLRIGEAGADWYWILTGERRPEALDRTTSAIVNIVADLDDAKRDTLLAFLSAMRSG